MPSKKTAVAVAAGVLALGAGVGIAGVAAADPTPTPNPTATASGSPSPGTDRPGGGGRHGGGFRDGAQLTELADKLGVTEDQVSEALRAVREETRPTTPPDRAGPRASAMPPWPRRSPRSWSSTRRRSPRPWPRSARLGRPSGPPP